MGAQGNTTVNFGAFPGASDVTINITGQAGIVAGSCVEAWIRGEASADHSADEHVVETIDCRAYGIVAGTGFSIRAFNTSQLNEPIRPNRTPSTVTTPAAAMPVAGLRTAGAGDNGGGRGTRLYGIWNVSWCWN